MYPTVHEQEKKGDLVERGRQTAKVRRKIWYGLLLLLLFWAIWSGVFTLHPRLAVIEEDLAFLLKREAISPEELQWALDRIETGNLEVVETFLAERLALFKQVRTGKSP